MSLWKFNYLGVRSGQGLRLALAILLLLGYQSCSETGVIGPDGELKIVKWDDSCLNPDQVPSQGLPSHVHFSGFYPSVRASAYSNFYPEWLNTHKEISNWGNTVFVDYGFTEHYLNYQDQRNHFLRKLRFAQSRNKSVILTVSSLFFPLDENRLGERLELLPDYQTRWMAFVEMVSPYIDSIVAFRPTDEPYWRGRNQKINNISVKDALDKVMREIKNSFPQKPIFLIHSSVELDSNFLPLELVEWVGFDCYRNFEQCGVENINGLKSVPEWIQILKGKLFPHQKIILVPDAFTMGESRTNQDQDVVVELVKKYVEYTKNDPDIIGFFPFVYRSTTNQLETINGTDNMCKVYHHYDKLFNRSRANLSSYRMYDSVIGKPSFSESSQIKTQLFYLYDQNKDSYGYHLSLTSEGPLEVKNSVDNQWRKPDCQAYRCFENSGQYSYVLDRKFSNYPDAIRGTVLTISFRPAGVGSGEVNIPIQIGF